MRTRTRYFGRLAWLLAGCLVANSLGVWQSPARCESLRHTPVVAAVKQTRRSIVNIHGRKTIRSDTAASRKGSVRLVNGMGTGVVIDRRGYILTNYHVIEDVEKIHVTLANQDRVVGKLINYDAANDLAVIKIPPQSSLKLINIGTSGDLMEGETVIAIGNAYGYNHTVSEGIISALHRDVPVGDTQHYKDVIQTSASINPGNSGGPLLNIEGQMVGLVVAVRVGAQGIAFAIPVDKAMEVAANLITTEHGFSHGVVGEDRRQVLTRQCDALRKTLEEDLGILPEQVQEDQETLVSNADTRKLTELEEALKQLRNGPQFTVRTLVPNSAAAQSVLQVGDVIESVNGVPVRQRLDFERALIGESPGDEVEVMIRREGRKITTSLPLINRTWRLLGLHLKSIPQSELKQASPKYRGGLRVIKVRSDSLADRQGFRPGDILFAVHKWATTSQEDISFIIESREFTKTKSMKFRILRDGKEHILASSTGSRNLENRIWRSLGMRLKVLPQNEFQQFGTKYRGGLEVLDLREDGPAERQGIVRGDVLFGLHKWATVSLEDIAFIIDSREFSQIDVMKFRVIRDGEERLVDSSTSLPSLANRLWRLLGLRLENIPPTEFQQTTTKYRGGLRIISVRADSPADRQGLLAGDILIGLKGLETTTMDNLSFIIESSDFSRSELVKFYILREGETLYGDLKMASRN
ncbi:MAG: trypsin-like peptidase domain-containing protein [Planctomycetota bacterium]|nr:trypsin-like peptidase domain-containing protein [Planctomycetota bacterium]